MRPKLLEIEGLQSFRDLQRIDFETLGETGLFGIFGPTGSGKSTVLDAITFALYGKVKRAEGGTQGIINTSLNVAKVSFTFELIKDGGRKTYRVERTYQRRRGSTNSCEPKIVRLIEITDVGEIPVCDKATEVTNTIRELLGLNHEDFTRAVVLPQNSFQEFLLLNNSERRGMLERIFYLEEYGKKLQEKLSRKMAILKSRIDILSGELKAYADATDDALAEAKKAMEDAAAERNRIEKNLRQLEAKYNEAKEVWALVQELSLIDEREKQHLSSREAVSEKRIQLEKAEKADELMELIRENKELHEKLTEIDAQLEKVLEALPGIGSNLDTVRQKYEETKSEAASRQPALLEFRTRLVEAMRIRSEIRDTYGKIRELQDMTDKLKHEIDGKTAAIEKEEGELEALEKNLGRLKLEMEPLKVDPEYRQQLQVGARLEGEVEALKGNVRDLEGKAEALRHAISDSERKLEQVRKDISSSQKALDELDAQKREHEAARPADKNTVYQYIEKLHALQTQYNILRLKNKELDDMSFRIAKLQSLLKEAMGKAAISDKNREKVGALYEQCRKDVEDLTGELNRNAAYMLSKNLVEGMPCPVCGSKHHPAPPVQLEGIELPLLERRLEEARGKMADAEKVFREAERSVLVANERVKAYQTQVDQALQELESKTRDFQAEKQKLPEKLMELSLEQVRRELEKMNRVSEEKLKAAEAWEKKLEVYREELQKCNETMASHRLSEKEILTELKVNRDNLERIQKDLAEAGKLFSERQAQYSRFLQQYHITGVTAELARIAENDRRMNVLQERMEKTQESLSSRKTLLEQWKEELRTVTSSEMKVQIEIGNLCTLKEEKEARLQELSGGVDIEDEIKRIDEKLDEYVRLEKQYHEKLQALEKQYNDLVTQKSLLHNQQAIYNESLKREESRLKASLAAKGFKDTKEAESFMLPLEKQRALKDEIDDYDRMGRNIQAQKEMVQSKLNSRSITEEQWNQINSAYQELLSLKEEWTSRSEVARNTFENLNIKHEKWVELNNLNKELVHKYGLLEQIQKLLRAEHRKDNSFIDFIAEERLRYVAAKASETLGFMTKYRYALELDTNAGFIIRDNGNGGVHRMVTSLSGGETFLTSLSLALALSEQIQLKGQSPLEFFFLDEGFGTLDNSLLDTVIDALERLSRKDRVIGLISHVPELRSRITRRLVVDPPTSQGDGSRVRIEKA